ncbi:sensor histidine kinase [Demequina zhanjiangensis]|uniref:histidine kinase n=1 Tax=Demequina zhanjiangensis TaxID=3051659 RepID=A0ABT8FXF9_9MICO|nr:sensor histidine kinase [Demequina sp. SYSU T00b26]MDN4471595.1 sensor domain-containing protein [Demequina sp. SYSU T00b26]
MSLLRYLAAPYSARTAGELAFLLLGLPMGVVWFTYAITMYAVSLSLLIVWVGFVTFAATQVSMRGVSAIERAQVNWLLRERVVAPGRRPAPEGGGSPWRHPARWTLALAHDGAAWRALAWVAVRVVTGPVGFALALVAIVVPLSLVTATAATVGYELGWMDIGWTGAPHYWDAGGWRWGYAGLPLALLLAPALTLSARGFATLHRSLARWALGPCRSDQVAEATERAELAEAQLRIDQELHDSIGHMITMNIVQAGAGAHVFDSDPEFARQALRNIEERGRAAMGELDRIIAHLRGDEAAARAPLPTLDDIEGLVETSRRGGARVAFSLEADGVPPAVGRTAFGIVREALTNAAKHAPGASIDVQVALDDDALGIAVVNGRPAAPAAPAHSTGRGVDGMRDRITLLGGRSLIGPREGGFQVLALLPLGAGLARTGDPTRPWASLREKVSA